MTTIHSRSLRTFSVLACLLVLAALLLTALPLSARAETVTVTASGMDMARGAGQLIIYTSAYGASTNTNEWGYEAAVGSDHKVLSVGGNNTKIPEGGFVLSGHDTDDGVKMKTWVRSNVKVGQYVYYNPVTLLVTVSDQPIEDDASAFYSIESKLTGINAVRYENNLIVYTPAKGKNTGTNEYGYEVVVNNGLVEAVSGNNSAIPANGFVVSGHGTAGDWLRSQVKLGMGCTYDAANKTVTFSMDDKSLLAGLQRSLELAVEARDSAKADYLYMDYDAFETKRKEVAEQLKQAEADYKKSKNKSKLVSACDELRSSIVDLQNYVCESVTVQYRAAWLRPSQSSAAEVDAFVEKLYQQGINTLCVEGLFSSTVIMNVPEGSLFEHNPSFNYDVLQAYIDACHKRNMECHLWMAIFHISNINGTNYTKSVAKKKPEWLCKNHMGTLQNENDFLMIDPSNREATDYLISFYEYLVKNYDIDCFELDYIRYCDSTEIDFGYTEAAFEGFRKAYKTDITPTFDRKASFWNNWAQYRCDAISNFVKKLSGALRKARPGILLSADVVPRPDTAKTYNYQDYLPWVSNGWIDILHPMAYGDGFDDSIKNQVVQGGSYCMVATGLGVYIDSLGAQEMVSQAIRDNELGAFGDVYFEASAYLADKTGEALKKTVYRNGALAPFLDRSASLRELIAYLVGHAENVIRPNGGMSKSELETITGLAKTLSDTIENGQLDGPTLQSLNTAIRKLEDKKAYAALNRDFNRLTMIATVFNKCKVYDLYEGNYTAPDTTSADPVSDTPSEDIHESSAPDPVSDEPDEGSGPAVSDDSGKPAESAEPVSTASLPADSSSEATSSSGGLPAGAWVGIGAGILALAVGAFFLARKIAK
ncbi:MAG: family 10 glycosylhydrolase [Clostridia bacterium]|nr:family 10 glycosylhydrolase [Clostridia bacterium]